GRSRSLPGGGLSTARHQTGRSTSASGVRRRIVGLIPFVRDSSAIHFILRSSLLRTLGAPLTFRSDRARCAAKHQTQRCAGGHWFCATGCSDIDASKAIRWRRERGQVMKAPAALITVAVLGAALALGSSMVAQTANRLTDGDVRKLFEAVNDGRD